MNVKVKNFLRDYWEEVKRYHGLISLLTDWRVFEPPKENFQHRPYIRLFYFFMQFMLVIGVGVWLECQAGIDNEALDEFLAIFLINIPTEIFLLVWFRLYWTEIELEKSGKKQHFEEKRHVRYCWLFSKGCGVCMGVLMGLIVFVYALTLFLVAFLAPHRYCSTEGVNDAVWHLFLIQFFLIELYMVLPYWRDEGFLLEFLGPFGVTLGLLSHVIHQWSRKSNKMLLNDTQMVDIENEDCAKKLQKDENHEKCKTAITNDELKGDSVAEGDVGMMSPNKEARSPVVVDEEEVMSPMQPPVPCC